MVCWSNKNLKKSSTGLVYKTYCGIVLAVIISLPVFAENQTNFQPEVNDLLLEQGFEYFDHVETGFPLTGHHLRLNCADCHAGNSYEKLPLRCDSCHNNSVAVGLPNGHFAVSAPCDTCHTTLGFIENIQMDHRAVNATCVTCHNGFTSHGKSASHMLTSDECEACHNSRSWFLVLTVDHSQVISSNCISCHDNVRAMGRDPLTHSNTSNHCDACHSESRESWVVVKVDHEHVRGECENCHRVGVSESSSRHQYMLSTCEACHNVVNWNVVRFDHNAVSVSGCVKCHDGAMVSGKTAAHINTSNQCESCHSAGISWQVTTPINHSEVRGGCQECHQFSTLHVFVNVQCDACHNVYNWEVSVMNHSAVTSVNCSDCHNNQIVSGKPLSHCPTNSACNHCHSNSHWQTNRSCEN